MYPPVCNVRVTCRNGHCHYTFVVREGHAVEKKVGGGTMRTLKLDEGVKGRKGKERGHKSPGAVDLFCVLSSRLLRSFTEFD